ncbi:MAG: DUF1016 domain-containing protein [Betaproteobacteria bacterium HGW-Betaproteobacteria-10]|nr:MAG: DUF1016 domain-containing protein [Betaproteobacteria bacterium HGW-Betaproteobacteria-10]
MTSPPLPSNNFLLGEIKSLIENARNTAVRQVNALQVMVNFEIGRRIVEEEQQGANRAEYGRQLLQTLADGLTSEFGKGFSQRNLEYMRKFFLAYRDRPTQISQKPSAKSAGTDNGVVNRQLPLPPNPFTLSWSHYVFLIGIKSTDQRRFYEIESAQNGWSLPELRRQFDSSLFERLALSRSPDEIRQLSQQGQMLVSPTDLIKNPYVLEFLGLEARSSYSESDLESAIISKIEHFLLELGKGFLFEARQKRFTFEEEHFFVDLVFYNRQLRCYVLIDLKLGKLTHQNLGQMQMYVNYFDRFVKRDDENSTIGIILCKKKNDALVEITLPRDANIHASEYQLYLPSKAELQQRLNEWTAEGEALLSSAPAKIAPHPGDEAV